MIPRPATTFAIACSLLVASASPGRAQTTPYQLSVGSEFRTGCFAQLCGCPPIQSPITGGFVLVRQPSSPPFTQYLVLGVNGSVQFPEDKVSIIGNGTYRIGGTGQLQQQMTLDVSVGGAAPVHFDSGLVPGGDSFPRLVVDLTLHRAAECADTMLRVRANPGGQLTSVGTGDLRLSSLAPNPFRSGTRLEFLLLAAGPVRASVLDLAGRRVRTLADGGWLDAGPSAFTWDGRADDGRACPAGCYFLRVEAGGKAERRIVVKLD